MAARPMRLLDFVLQDWRARVARRWIPEGARVLDIGCHQGELLRNLGDRIGPSVGMDPLAPGGAVGRHTLLAEPFREPAPFPDGSFDVIVLLATIEHIQDKTPLIRECLRLLRPPGRVIVTVPSRAVDRIVVLLRSLRLADGMSLEEHHGFDPRDTPRLFADGFTLLHRRRFQAGLNNLYVFRGARDGVEHLQGRGEAPAAGVAATRPSLAGRPVLALDPAPSPDLWKGREAPRWPHPEA